MSMTLRTGALLGLMLTAVSVAAAPIEFNIQTLGLTDSEHTNPVNGQRESSLSRAFADGTVLGSSVRYGENGSNLGYSAWVHDAGGTRRIGLDDTEHTRSTDGYQSQSTYAFQDSGHGVVGFATRYDSNGTAVGGSTWHYNGSTTQVIGLTDSEHTRSTDNYRLVNVTRVERNWVVGRVNRYDEAGEYNGFSSWAFDGNTTTRLGLIDAEHTRPGDNERRTFFGEINSNGTMVGWSTRYAGAGDSGQISNWIYSNGVTQRIGLIDTAHTRVTDGAQASGTLAYLSDNDVVAGTSERFGATGESLGESAWRHADGVTTLVAFSGSEFVRPTDGYRNYQIRGISDDGAISGNASRFLADGSNWGSSAWIYRDGEMRDIGLQGWTYEAPNGLRGANVNAMNGSGMVAGVSTRINPFTGEYAGQDAWYFDGNSTRMVGLVDAEHMLGAERNNYISMLTESGWVAGRARRYDYRAAGGRAGWSAWISDGTQTIRVGLFDEDHTLSANNFQFTFVGIGTDEGLFAGQSSRYGAQGYLGRTAWLFDGENVIAMDSLGFNSMGEGSSTIDLVTDDGIAFGSYTKYSDLDELLGSYAYMYSSELGQVDLGMQVNGSFEEDGWEMLSRATLLADNGDIYGWGYKTDGTANAFRMSVVPVPPAIWLFVSGIGALLASRKRV